MSVFTVFICGELDDICDVSAATAQHSLVVPSTVYASPDGGRVILELTRTGLPHSWLEIHENRRTKSGVVPK